VTTSLTTEKASIALGSVEPLLQVPVRGEPGGQAGASTLSPHAPSALDFGSPQLSTAQRFAANVSVTRRRLEEIAMTSI